MGIFEQDCQIAGTSRGRLKRMPSCMKMNTETKTKKCTICKTDKEIGDFIKKCGMCKPCRTVHRKQYRKDNLEAFKEKGKKHYEKQRKTKREQQKEYYQKNKEKIQAQRTTFREDNPEHHKKQQRKAYMNNLDKRLGIVYRNRVRSELGSGKGYSKMLGCSIDILKRWFEFNFEYDGDYCWDNFGDVWEIDHVIPCCNFDMSDENMVSKCFNWENTKPLSKSKNRSKNRYIWKHLCLEQELRVFLFKKRLHSI